MLWTILIIALIVALLVSPAAPYGRTWGYTPAASVIGIACLAVLLIYFFSGRAP